MTDVQVSPISQLLHTLGLTREDLNKRSDQMRQFLTADDAMFSRVLESENSYGSRSGSDLRSSSRSVGSSHSLARSLSRASSNSLRDVTPPATPVKSEPHEVGMPHRRLDSMEMVLERQRRRRKSRKGKERESSRSMPHPPSPSPSNASQSGLSLDLFMQSRDDLRVPTAVATPSDVVVTLEAVEPPPVTPQKNKYYREHTNLGSTSQPHKNTPCKTETPTPTRPSTETPSETHLLPSYYAYPAYIPYTHYLPIPCASAQPSSSTPMTPHARHILPPSHKEMASPLPPSSPPPPSSPQSSPARFNLVSSPGPMGPLPQEEEYDNLPYTLPPGPYSPKKPDLSYAALVGRAILSSPEHRLTLQEIYDWITIVYPHYKRGETTWMNSIRHVLSTTVCFRKVPRDRAVGRTLWAIWDEDLACFKDGGFRKHLCKEYANTNEGKDKVTGSSKGKPRVRKRVEDYDSMEGRKTKRIKKDQLATSSSEPPAFAGPAPLSHPLFPPTRPTPHHQPYYESCIPQPQVLPAEIIFPPLPATAAFNRVVHSNTSSSACGTTMSETHTTPPSFSQFPSLSSSFSSIPDLTPNRNSSSPPSSFPATSDMEVDGRLLNTKDDGCLLADSSIGSKGGPEIDAPPSSEDDMFNTALLGPVRFWDDSPKAPTVLQPGIELFNSDSISEEESEGSLHDKKGKKLVPRNIKIIFPPVPTSPTPKCRGKRKKSGDDNRPSTPSPISTIPSTPPRNGNQHQISSIRTPLSHKGLHMSPTASLVHYKSNLDPPPLYNTWHADDNPTEGNDEVVDSMRTPRKRMPKADTSNLYEPPVTPKKLIFPTGLDDSPFRTPSGGLGASPFRTPNSRSIIDPHDPRALLDEELNRIGNSYGDSPAGLFGKGRGSLLYDSPGLDSPGKWSKWW